MWYPPRMSHEDPMIFCHLYESFHSPLCDKNCGNKCSPYNEIGVPFCCDINHAIPLAYQIEWEYLFSNTDLWHLWKPEDIQIYKQLKNEVSPNQVLIECLGHNQCQRDYRSITCRAFPFFPYINEENNFLGLTYYWEYEDRCWIISNLGDVSNKYRNEFVATFDTLFELMPEELETYIHFSNVARQRYKRRNRSLPLLHRNNYDYMISNRTGELRKTNLVNSPKYGPYKIASELPFPDELNEDWS